MAKGKNKRSVRSRHSSKRSTRRSTARPAKKALWMAPAVKDGDLDGLSKAIRAAEGELASERANGFGKRSTHVEGQLNLLRQRKEQALKRPSAVDTYSKMGTTLAASGGGAWAGHKLANAVENRHVAAVTKANVELKALARNTTGTLTKVAKGTITPAIAQNTLQANAKAANLSQITQRRGMIGKPRYAMSRGPGGVLGGVFLIGAGLASRYGAESLSNDKAEQSAIRTAGTVEMMAGAGMLGTRLLQTMTPAVMLDAESAAKIAAGAKHDSAALTGLKQINKAPVLKGTKAKSAPKPGSVAAMHAEAKQMGLKVTGTGKGGRVNGSDLKAALQNAAMTSGKVNPNSPWKLGSKIAKVGSKLPGSGTLLGLTATGALAASAIMSNTQTAAASDMAGKKKETSSPDVGRALRVGVGVGLGYSIYHYPKETLAAFKDVAKLGGKAVRAVTGRALMPLMVAGSGVMAAKNAHAAGEGASSVAKAGALGTLKSADGMLTLGYGAKSMNSLQTAIKIQSGGPGANEARKDFNDRRETRQAANVKEHSQLREQDKLFDGSNMLERDINLAYSSVRKGFNGLFGISSAKADSPVEPPKSKYVIKKLNSNERVDRALVGTVSMAAGNAGILGSMYLHDAGKAVSKLPFAGAKVAGAGLKAASWVAGGSSAILTTSGVVIAGEAVMGKSVVRAEPKAGAGKAYLNDGAKKKASTATTRKPATRQAEVTSPDGSKSTVNYTITTGKKKGQTVRMSAARAKSLRARSK